VRGVAGGRLYRRACAPPYLPEEEVTIDFLKTAKSTTVWSALAMFIFALTGMEISVVINGKVFPLDRLPEALAFVGILMGRATAKGPLVGNGGENA
jgi:hypothetical protein